MASIEQEVIDRFASRLCDMADQDYPDASAAFAALSEGCQFSPSDRIFAQFLLACHEVRGGYLARPALSERLFRR